MAILSCSTPYNPLSRTNHPTGIQTMMWKDRILGHAAVIQPYSAFDCEILAERKRVEDEITRKAKRAASELEKVEIEPGALTLVKEAVYDKQPENFPSWDMLHELFDQIIAFPGSALAFKYLLVNAAQFRADCITKQKVFPNVGVDLLRAKLDGMIERIASAVQVELGVWDAGEPVSEREMKYYRPADIYRRYGLALRYAVEELGSFQAKDALNELMCATTLPIDELENPAWVDPYTGEGDKGYEIIRVRGSESELSSDGNLPATLADLIDNLGEEGASQFHKDLERLGMSVGDYWRQCIEAQRSGFSPLPEPEDEREEAEFDVIEKDFTGQGDLRVDHDEYVKVYQAVGW
ncbi:MAG: hypothetical protein IH586_14715, partial [Anaerolineaceae bacterium]|nr:hypothetical protein [Anaerolineaceae bacterium]